MVAPVEIQVVLTYSTSIHVGHNNIVSLIMSLREYNMRRALHQGSGAIAQEFALGADITGDNNAIFWAGIIIS